MLNVNRSKKDLFDRRRSQNTENLSSSSILSFDGNDRGIQPNCGYSIHNQSTSAKRAELLSQLPASTKISSVRSMKPINIFQTEDIVHQYSPLMPIKSSYPSFVENIETNTFVDNSMVNSLSLQLLYTNLTAFTFQSTYVYHYRLLRRLVVGNKF